MISQQHPFEDWCQAISPGVSQNHQTKILTRERDRQFVVLSVNELGKCTPTIKTQLKLGFPKSTHIYIYMCIYMLYMYIYAIYVYICIYIYIVRIYMYTTLSTSLDLRPSQATCMGQPRKGCSPLGTYISSRKKFIRIDSWAIQIP